MINSLKEIISKFHDMFQQRKRKGYSISMDRDKSNPLVGKLIVNVEITDPLLIQAYLQHTKKGK